MALAPVTRLRKDEIVWLSTHSCKRHRHTYLTHYNCYEKEGQVREKIGFFDIETTDFKADYGYMLSYCIKEEDGPIYGRCLNGPKEIVQEHLWDKQLVKDMLEDFKRFDRIISYFGSGFDLPFVRTRALIHGIKNFPAYSEKNHTDDYFVVKHKFKFRRNSLGVACHALGIPAKEHPIDSEVWKRAAAGDQGALNYIFKHNKEDVVCLEKLHKRIDKYSRFTRRSI